MTVRDGLSVFDGLKKYSWRCNGVLKNVGESSRSGRIVTTQEHEIHPFTGKDVELTLSNARQFLISRETLSNEQVKKLFQITISQPRTAPKSYSV